MLYIELRKFGLLYGRSGKQANRFLYFCGEPLPNRMALVRAGTRMHRANQLAAHEPELYEAWCVWHRLTTGEKL